MHQGSRCVFWAHSTYCSHTAWSGTAYLAFNLFMGNLNHTDTLIGRSCWFRGRKNPQLACWEAVISSSTSAWVFALHRQHFLTLTDTQHSFCLAKTHTSPQTQWEYGGLLFLFKLTFARNTSDITHCNPSLCHTLHTHTAHTHWTHTAHCTLLCETSCPRLRLSQWI